MVCCGSASGWVKVACLLLIVALPLHIAGYATVYWLSVYTVAENYAAGIGLWKMENCTNNAYSNPCQTNLEVPVSYKTSEFVATEAFETITLILLLFATVFILLYVLIRRLRTLCMALAITIMCLLTVTFSVIGMIINVINIPKNHYVNYSFGLTVIAFVLSFLAGVLMFAETRRYGLPDPDVVSEASAQEKSKLDEVRNPKYYDNYSRGWKRDEERDRYITEKEREAYYDKHRTDIVHYNNPNRETYTRDQFASPAPSYLSAITPLRPSRMSPISVRTDTTLRSHVQTPDIFLGRNDMPDVEQPRRYLV